MDIIYVPDAEFVAFIKSQGDKARVEGLEGHFRWVITNQDGSEYICRPESAKTNEPNSPEMP